MISTEYRVVLTNGKVEHTYILRAFNITEAIILAQADAIKQARGYELVNATIEC